VNCQLTNRGAPNQECSNPTESRSEQNPQLLDPARSRARSSGEHLY